MEKSIIKELLQNEQPVSSGSIAEDMLINEMRETVKAMKNFTFKLASEIANQTETSLDDYFTKKFDDDVLLSLGSLPFLFNDKMQLSFKYISDNEWELHASTHPNESTIENYILKNDYTDPERAYHFFHSPEGLDEYDTCDGKPYVSYNFKNLAIYKHHLNEMYKRAKEYFTIMYKDKISDDIFNLILDDKAKSIEEPKQAGVNEIKKPV